MTDLRLNKGTGDAQTPVNGTESPANDENPIVEGGEKTSGANTTSDTFARVTPDAVEAKQTAESRDTQARIALQSPSIKLLLMNAKSMVAGNERLEPEHVALAILESTHVDVSDEDRQALLDSALQYGGGPGAGMSDRMKAVLADSALRSADAEVTIETLTTVLRDSRDAYAPTFVRLLAAGQLADILPAGEAASIEDRPVFKPLEFPTLKGLGRDLVIEASEGRIDNTVGRSAEVEDVLEILGQRKLGNPVLTGERGVGKTAIAKGIALMIAEGRAPQQWKNTRIIQTTADTLATQAQGDVGAFLEKIATEVEQAKSGEPPMRVVLMIEEIHMLMQGPAAQMNVANHLKMFLDSGRLSIIGSSTTQEYKETIRTDGALKDRLPEVKVEIPDDDTAVRMLLANVARFEEFHGIDIHPSAVTMAVKLAGFMGDAVLPRSAVNLLDRTCSMVKQQIQADPPRLRMLRSDIEEIGRALEQARDGDDRDSQEARRQLSDQLAEATAAYAEMSQQADTERELLRQLRASGVALEDALKDPNEKGDEIRQQRANITTARAALNELPRRLYHIVVDSYAVGQKVSDITGIPVEKLQAKEESDYLHVVETLSEDVDGQDHMKEQLAEALQLERAGLRDPDGPIGTFLFAGQTGTGKTYLSQVLADKYFGGHLIRFDGNEMMARHELAKLLGAPPGYVGFDAGSPLLEEVRRANGRAVILIDEVEKAHPDIFKLLMQAMDSGIVRDNQGREVDLRNCVIIMTSNLASNTMAANAGDGKYNDQAAVEKALMDAMMAPRQAEGLGRKEIRMRINNLNDDSQLSRALFLPHSRAGMERILNRQFKKLAAALEENSGRLLDYSKAARAYLAKACFTPQGGARGLKQRLKDLVNKPLAQLVLNGKVNEGAHIMLNLVEAEGEDAQLEFAEMTDEQRAAFYQRRAGTEAKATPARPAKKSDPDSPSSAAAASIG